MNRLQRAVARVAAAIGITRDEFQRTHHVALLDAAVNNGFVACKRGVYTVTESGHRFINHH